MRDAADMVVIADESHRSQYMLGRSADLLDRFREKYIQPLSTIPEPPRDGGPIDDPARFAESASAFFLADLRELAQDPAKGKKAEAEDVLQLELLPHLLRYIDEHSEGSCTTASASDSVEDGPDPPNGFYWKGTRYVAPIGVAMKVLKILWEARLKKVTFDQLGDKCWDGQSGNEIKDGAFGGVRTRLNSFFKDHGIPCRVTKLDEFALLELEK
ncbi:MAG: hypothetical protein KDA44_15995 [Planctomycetales bacterium]|nr:hypothetical protein [Planctomycetales bacterium]